MEVARTYRAEQSRGSKWREAGTRRGVKQSQVRKGDAADMGGAAGHGKRVAMGGMQQHWVRESFEAEQGRVSA